MATKTIIVCDGCGTPVEENEPLTVSLQGQRLPAHHASYDLCVHCTEHMVKLIHPKNWPPLPWAPANPLRGTLRLPKPVIPDKITRPRGMVEGGRIVLMGIKEVNKE